MFRISDLQTCLTGIIGIRREANPSFASLYDSLLVSDSGMYLQGLHPLFSLNTLYSIAEDVSLYTYPDYDIGTTYARGDRVKSGGILYESAVNANTENSVTDTDFWTYKDFFSEWILNVFKDSAVRTINDLMTVKKINETAKTILSDINLYDGYGIPTDKILKSSRFVFFEIEPKFGANITINLKSFAGQFDSDQSFNLYVYHTSQSEPLYTLPIVLNKNFSMQSVTLPANTSMSNLNGTYYIGYYEDDIAGQAIEKRNYFWGKYVGGTYYPGPCGSCNPVNTNLYNKWSKYVAVTAGYVREEDQNSGTMWNIEKNIYSYNTNWGMNLIFSVECDITDFLCANKNVLASPISKRITVDMLEQIGYNTRNNIISEQTRSKALLALDDRNTNTGVRNDYDRAIKALDFDLSALSTCLPCHKKQVIKNVAI